MLKLLRRMRRRELITAALCALLVLGQIYFDLALPDYMTDLTTLIKTPGSLPADIAAVGGRMLLCALASAVLAITAGFLAARTAAGFSFSVREDLFHHVMELGSAEMQEFSVPSLITRTTNGNVGAEARAPRSVDHRAVFQYIVQQSQHPISS